MNNKVCRIGLRKGQPLSLYTHTYTSFLDLPREIRDRIYFLALVTPWPITVSSVSCDNGWPDRETDLNGKTTKTTITSLYILQPPDPILNLLVTSLLFCSRTVSCEAAATFYQHNIFLFKGDEVWSPRYNFLDRIGDTNIAYLQHISVDIKQPEYLSVDRRGIACISRYYNPFQKVYSSTPLGCSNSGEEMHYLDPAIEACFRALGNHKRGLVLRLLLCPFTLPGVEVCTTDPLNHNFPPWYSMDLPDHVERSRKRFGSRVNVLWEGVGMRDLFFKEKETMDNKGWDIVEAKEREYMPPHPVTLPRPPWYPYLTMFFVLRRRDLGIS